MTKKHWFQLAVYKDFLTTKIEKILGKIFGFVLTNDLFLGTIIDEVIKMTEKIKITLPKSTLELMRKDCRDFLFLKKDRSPNLNDFLNTLILNYYEAFSAGEEQLHDDIEKALCNVPQAYRKEAIGAVLQVLAKREKQRYEGKGGSLSFKPTKESEGATVVIEHILLSDESLSSYYRRLFLSYAQKSKNEREKLLHKQNYELLSHAVKKGVQVCLFLQNGTVINNASIYAIAPAKDELFNYVLSCEGEKNKTVRLAKIRTVSLLPDRSAIPEDCQALFEKQIACGAQYPMYATDDTPIRVQLSEKGKTLFEKIYLYRPTPSKIEGDIYTFECSANQVLYYFERFGDSALILSPKRLGISMRNYYHYALKKYRSVYNKE